MRAQAESTSDEGDLRDKKFDLTAVLWTSR
jgi:hypothetical protein